MSESIYIKETHEFMLSTGCIVKEEDLTKEEIAELKSECSQVNRLFGSANDSSNVIKG